MQSNFLCPPHQIETWHRCVYLLERELKFSVLALIPTAHFEAFRNSRGRSSA